MSWVCKTRVQSNRTTETRSVFLRHFACSLLEYRENEYQGVHSDRCRFGFVSFVRDSEEFVVKREGGFGSAQFKDEVGRRSNVRSPELEG